MDNLASGVPKRQLKAICIGGRSGPQKRPVQQVKNEKACFSAEASSLRLATVAGTALFFALRLSVIDGTFCVLMT